MYFRDLTNKILSLSKGFPIIALLGPRQSGKTTLVKKLFNHYEYTNLENLNQRELAQSDPPYFLQSYKKNGGLIIDEAQHAPNLFSYIQLAVDDANNETQFILTGSQNFLLNEKISQTLAGRVAILELLPLSMNELTLATLLSSDLNQAMLQGGYPRIFEKQLSPADWYMNYIRTYLERDVRQIKNVTDLSTFQKFLKLCAGRIGQLINFSDLGRDCGISYQTAKAWISLLESSFILFMMPSYHRNYNKRIIKSNKLYFYDTGIACNLLQIESPDQLSQHYLRGNLFESYIISELVKQRLNQGKLPDCYFWRDSNGHEVDCILERADGAIPIEIKSGTTLSTDFFHGLRYWCELTNTPSERAYLIFGGNENQTRRDGNVLGWSSLTSLYQNEK